MPRRAQPTPVTFRRPRNGEAVQPQPRAKRLPITSLWDEMTSAAPVDVADPIAALWPDDPPVASKQVASLWPDDPPAASKRAAAPQDGRDAEWDWSLDDEGRELDVPEVVIRHVSGLTGAAALLGAGEASAPIPRGREGSGIHVTPLNSTAHAPQLEGVTAAESRHAWPRAPIAPPLVQPRAGVRGAMVALGLVFVVAAWRSSQPSSASAGSERAQLVQATAPVREPAAVSVAAPVPPVSAPALMVTAIEELERPAPAADGKVMQPEDLLAPPPMFVPGVEVGGARPEPVGPVAQVATPAAVPVPEPDAAPGERSDAGFDYRSAKRYLDEQSDYLRKTCMRKAGAPVKLLRVRVEAKPSGRAAIDTKGAAPAVRKCVREALRFPFDPSPHGGAFDYTLTDAKSRIERRSR
jgi:hypothetical protein